MSVFNLLNSTVNQLAVSRFKEPTSIQKLVIPKALKGKNLLVIAGTGLGKTESAMLPLFNNLSQKEHKPISLLYITPLKSLNRDMFERLLWWCNKLDLDISVRHGDTTQHERKLQVEHPPHILITTPEQIQGMMTGKRLRKLLENIKYIVVDELHELVESKRGVQLTLSLERLKEICGDPQIIALSATVGSPKEAAKFIFGNKKYEIVKAISPKDVSIEVRCPSPTEDDKKLGEKIFIGDAVAARLKCMYDIIKEHRSALTFTNTREAAEVLSSRLRIMDKELPHEVHHSSLSKSVRVNAEKEFKEEKLKSLICTSSLELGIDIGAIDIVLQYMSPRQVSKLVQRIGRSGHGVGRLSKGFIISSDDDELFESVVVARKALKGELEPLRIHSKSLDVLAHQIVGLLMVSYEMEPKKIYQILKRATPFSNLGEKEFQTVVNFLEQLRIIFSADGKIKRRRRAFEYYFQNLSVIPDNISYKVIDMTLNSFVGTLDESFVAEHSDTGSTFIVKGRPWKVVSVENDKVFVEPATAIESSVPAWHGELIPVPYDVANEVGKLRRWISDMLQDMKKHEIVSEIKERYPVSTDAANKLISIIKKHTKKYPLPDDRHIVFENYKDYVVMNCCFGSLVNETLSKYITALLSAEYGTVMTSKSDPYRIIFNKVLVNDIKKIIKNHKKGEIKIVLEKALSRSSLFKSRFMHVAKRFGAVQRGAKFEKINVDKLTDIYWNSPIHNEAMKEIYTEKLDVEKAEQIIDEIKKGGIKFVDSSGLSPLGELGFQFELRGVVRPSRPESEIFKMFKERLLKTKARLLCVNCGKYSITQYVRDIKKEPRCSLCGSKLIGVVHPVDRDAQKIVIKRLEGKPLTNEQQKMYDRIYQTANLTIVYGRKAVFVLAGRGVGSVNATRILAKPNLTEDELLKNILKAERDFIANKRFWT